jgi:hypothetical protein
VGTNSEFNAVGCLLTPMPEALTGTGRGGRRSDALSPLFGLGNSTAALRLARAYPVIIPDFPA